MTSDALAAERARFWRSVWRYYRYINRASGSAKCYDELAWEHAKERLLAVAEREKWGPAPVEPAPPAPHYRHRCPACGEKQEGNEVCAECVALYGSAEQALARKRKEAARIPHEQAVAKYQPSRSMAEIHAAKEQRAARLCAALRDHLAKYGALHAPTMALMLGVGKRELIDRLHDIQRGADGGPPLRIAAASNRADPYWRVAG